MAWSYTFTLPDKIESCYYDCPLQFKCGDDSKVKCPLTMEDVWPVSIKRPDCPLIESEVENER